MTDITIMAGAEPFYAQNGNVGVLVSHGFTGNPQSMRYLAEGLARAGFTVALPRLKGSIRRDTGDRQIDRHLRSS